MKLRWLVEKYDSFETPKDAAYHHAGRSKIIRERRVLQYQASEGLPWITVPEFHPGNEFFLPVSDKQSFNKFEEPKRGRPTTNEIKPIIRKPRVNNYQGKTYTTEEIEKLRANLPHYAVEIQLLRNSLNWSQSDLASKMNMSQGMISLIERGGSRSKVTDEVLARFAQVFEKDLSHFKDDK